MDNYNYLQDTWQKNRMAVFKDFLLWYNNKDLVPTFGINNYHFSCKIVMLINCFLFLIYDESFLQNVQVRKNRG